MVIFHGYVKLPEGKPTIDQPIWSHVTVAA